MIVAFFGQPCSGKTTLCRKFFSYIKHNLPIRCHYMDGDKFRYVFSNKDYSKEGRLRNLKLACDIAHYQESLNDIVLMSFVFPYKEARDYLKENNKNVVFIYLEYEKEVDFRGRENFHVEDFEIPTHDEVQLMLNTTATNEEQCFSEIIKTYKKYL